MIQILKGKLYLFENTNPILICFFKNYSKCIVLTCITVSDADMLESVELVNEMSCRPLILDSDADLIDSEKPDFSHAVELKNPDIFG